MSQLVVAEVGGAVALFAGSLAAEAVMTRWMSKQRFWAMGLATAAAIYVGFAAAGGRDWLALEAGGLASFGVLAAAAAWTDSVWIVALGWLLHPLWDVLLHASARGPDHSHWQVVPGVASHTPSWYPGACIVFDLAAAAWVILAAAPRSRDKAE